MKIKLPWEKLEKLKRPHKLGIYFGTILVLGAAFFFLLYQPMQARIISADEEIEKLETQIRTHLKTVRELPEIRARLEDVRLQYDFSKTFLPEKKDVDRLLSNISKEAAQAGLNVVLFQPQLQDEVKEFYAEISFELRVEGPYLRLATFFYNVGRLDRIVNVDDIKIGNPRFVEGQMILTTQCNGKTFRFLTEEELKAAEEAKEAAKKKGKKKK